MFAAIRDLPRLTSNQTNIVPFAATVKNNVAAMKKLGNQGYLNNIDLIRETLGKLPLVLVSKYNEYVASEGQPPSLEMLGKFLDREASLASIAGTVSMFDNTNRDSKKSDTRNSNKRHDNRDNNHGSSKRVFLIDESGSSKPRNFSCYYCSEAHLIRDCKEFLKLSVDDRWRWATTPGSKRCFRCLGKPDSEHVAKNCKAPSCKKDGCGRPHHILLHFPKRKSSKYPASSVNSTQGSSKST